MVKSQSSGFSLIELMVVIAIITVLSTAGFAVFSNAQARSRDSRRRLELDAIAKALETNRTDSGYQTLTGVQFQSGSIPTIDPSGYVYCISAPADTVPGTTWTNACPTGYNKVSTSVPAANSVSFRVCTSGETFGGTNILCKSNAQ